MADSTLVNYDIPAYSGNYTKNRSGNGGRISEITIHHAAGFLSLQDMGRMWQTAGKNVSSHYGVKNNEIAQYVPENAIAWTNSNWNANKRAVTIETVNSTGAPNWEVSDDSLNTLIKLVADIAKRNGLYPLIPGNTLTWHRMYSNTSCPGEYLLARMQYIANEANSIINGGGTINTVPSDENVAFSGKVSGVGNSLLNVRTGAGKQFGLLSSYPKLANGNQVDVLAQSGDWYKVKIAGAHIGYVYKNYIVEDTPANTPQFEPFVGYATNLNGKHLNVRNAPDTSTGVINGYPQLAEGNEFVVNGEVGDWYYINIVNRFNGYVHKAYVARK